MISDNRISVVARMIVNAHRVHENALVIIPSGQRCKRWLSDEIDSLVGLGWSRNNFIWVTYDDGLDNDKLNGIVFSTIFVELGCCKSALIHNNQLPKDILQYINGFRLIQPIKIIKFGYYNEVLVKIDPISEDHIDNPRFMTIAKSDESNVKFYKNEAELIYDIKNGKQRFMDIYKLVPMVLYPGQLVFRRDDMKIGSSHKSVHKWWFW